MVNYNALPLFSGFGIEIEYMIAKSSNLNIAPIADKLLYDKNDGYQTEITDGLLRYSNELALHVIELKTNGPCRNLVAASDQFSSLIAKLNNKLADYNSLLLPGGAHPWMDPYAEFKIWPHQYSPIYAAYDAIFDCRGHGWCNVQSTHLNLPFANDNEFARLHAAIRVLLPIIPVLTASSPIIELEPTGYKDSRLFFYANNQKNIPSIAGAIIPEILSSQDEYKNLVLKKMYQAIEPYDSSGVLQHEWLNSRGAIARFERNTIEIRIMDTQESPLMDLAIIALVIACLQNLVDEDWIDFIAQSHFSTKQLQSIYQESIKYGFNYKINDRNYLHAFKYYAGSCGIKDLWQHIFNLVEKSQYSLDKKFYQPLLTILNHGNLSERILLALNNDFSKINMAAIYAELAQCLQNNSIFNL